MWWSNARETSVPFLCLPLLGMDKRCRWRAGNPKLNISFSRHCGVSCKLNYLGFQTQKYKNICRTAQKNVRYISEKSSSSHCSLNVYINTNNHVQTFDADIPTCFVCIHKCVHLHLSLTHLCVLQYSISFCAYHQEYWWICILTMWYSCICEAGFPHKAQ